MFDRWRRARAGASAPEESLDALVADMTRHGVIIITRDDSGYVVYWARKQDESLHSRTADEVLKRSVEGRGETVLEGMRACRAKAMQ
jgi:hypothetical protein